MAGVYLRQIWTGGVCNIQNSGWKSTTKNSLLPGSLTSFVWLTLGAFAIGTEGFMIAGLPPALARDLNVGLLRCRCVDDAHAVRCDLTEIT